MSDFKLGIVEWAMPLPGPYGVRIAAEMGLQGFELDFGDYETGFKLYNERIQDAYLEMGAKYGIEYPALGINSLNRHGMSFGRDTLDGTIAMEAIEKGIETALKMNIPVVQLPSFEWAPIRSDKDFYNVCEMLKMACDMSEGTYLIIGFENDLDAKKTKEMIAEVANPRIKIFYDTQNYHLFKGIDQPTHLREVAEHVCMMHIKDGYNNLTSSALLGHGDVNFPETVEVIKETKCTEWLFLENFYATLPIRKVGKDSFDILRRDIAYVKETFEIA